MAARRVLSTNSSTGATRGLPVAAEAGASGCNGYVELVIGNRSGGGRVDSSAIRGVDRRVITISKNAFAAFHPQTLGEKVNKRTVLALTASGALCMGLTLFSGAGAALANQTDFFCTSNSTELCMCPTSYDASANYYVIQGNPPSGSPANVNCETGAESYYNNINGETWNNPVLGGGDPVYQWSETDGFGCLDWVKQTNRFVDYPCASKTASNFSFQQFWWRTNGELVNVKATDDDGELECVNLIKDAIGQEFDAAPCNGNENMTFLPY